MVAVIFLVEVAVGLAVRSNAGLGHLGGLTGVAELLAEPANVFGQPVLGRWAVVVRFSAGPAMLVRLLGGLALVVRLSVETMAVLRVFGLSALVFKLFVEQAAVFGHSEELAPVVGISVVFVRSWVEAIDMFRSIGGPVVVF